jgi:hypothetical protein
MNVKFIIVFQFYNTTGYSLQKEKIEFLKSTRLQKQDTSSLYQT